MIRLDKSTGQKRVELIKLPCLQVLDLPSIQQCVTTDANRANVEETNMEITVMSDKNPVTSQGLAISSQGLATSQGHLITVNSSDLLNIQVSTNGILPTSNGVPIINGSLLTSSGSISGSTPTTTR